eukprot:GHRQ01019634.1.p1 GENE.GHRQ01019634.1~~GHRQ01019634.1.p1  ORF type:complete len:180 (+),score=44.98 GHRQ01019634.1:120-659(+)
MHSLNTDDGTASDKDAIKVVVQTSTSWRALKNQPRASRSLAGENQSQAGRAMQAKASYIPGIEVPATAVGGKQQAELRQLVMVVVACISWVIASSGAILVNKHIMVDLHFPYPAFVCALGLVGTSIVSWLAVRVLRIVPANTPVSMHFFVTRIMPTGLFQALAMQLGNTAYLHLSGRCL